MMKVVARLFSFVFGGDKLGGGNARNGLLRGISEALNLEPKDELPEPEAK